jgi:hypothetical protein
MSGFSFLDYFTGAELEAGSMIAAPFGTKVSFFFAFIFLAGAPVAAAPPLPAVRFAAFAKMVKVR